MANTTSCPEKKKITGSGLRKASLTCMSPKNGVSFSSLVKITGNRSIPGTDDREGDLLAALEGKRRRRKFHLRKSAFSVSTIAQHVSLSNAQRKELNLAAMKFLTARRSGTVIGTVLI